jgi:hypothetical protein
VVCQFLIVEELSQMTVGKQRDLRRQLRIRTDLTGCTFGRWSYSGPDNRNEEGGRRQRGKFHGVGVR